MQLTSSRIVNCRKVHCWHSSVFLGQRSDYLNCKLYILKHLLDRHPLKQYILAMLQKRKRNNLRVLLDRRMFFKSLKKQGKTILKMALTCYFKAESHHCTDNSMFKFLFHKIISVIVLLAYQESAYSSNRRGRWIQILDMTLWHFLW